MNTEKAFFLMGNDKMLMVSLLMKLLSLEKLVLLRIGMGNGKHVKF